MAVLSYWRNLLLGCGSVIVSNCCFLSVSYIAKHQPVSPGETDFTKQTFELQGLLSMDGPRSRNVKISSDFLISKKMLWKIRPHWTGEIMTSRSIVQIIIFGSSFMFKVTTNYVLEVVELSEIEKKFKYFLLGVWPLLHSTLCDTVIVTVMCGIKGVSLWEFSI